MPRYRCTVEYNGTHFHGWQKQPDHISVQQCIIEAIEKFCGENVDVVGSGRTDTGVHAIGQVIHFDLSRNWPAQEVMGAVNFHLRPHAICLLDSSQTDDEFHARFSARKRYYTYHIITRKAPLVLENKRAWHVAHALDIHAMEQAANILVGEHDFSSFRDSECQAKSPIKTIDAITLEQQGERILIHIEARSFLHHMVRILVGTLKLVGEGKWQAEDVAQALAAKKRCAAGPTAPAYGLYFVRIEY